MSAPAPAVPRRGPGRVGRAGRPADRSGAGGQGRHDHRGLRRDRVKLGGHGLVVGLSGAGIRRAAGWRPAQPLNGQRCLTRAAFEAARPLARGWGVETALTIDLLRQGFRVTEVEVELAHRATGTDLRAQLHRAHQLADVARALAARR